MTIEQHYNSLPEKKKKSAMGNMSIQNIGTEDCSPIYTGMCILGS